MRRTGRKKCRRTKAQHQSKMKRYVKRGTIILVILSCILGAMRIVKPEWFQKDYIEIKNARVDASRPEIDVELLTVNPYSRPGTEVNRINGIVVHYTANPGSTAMGNRNYFEGLKDSHETKASSNFIVGLDGEIVQCVPTWEEAYASNSRNMDTVSIECCHPDESGKFNEETYRSMVQLCAWLCLKFDLNEEDIIRHYDVTGKICPKYFVEHEEAWETFKQDVGKAIARTKS